MLRTAARKVRQPVQRALQDISGRHLVDDLGPPRAGDIVLDQGSDDHGGGKALVPVGDRQVRPRREISGKSARRLRARSVAPFQGERQAENDRDDFEFREKRDERVCAFWNAPRANVFSGEASRRSTSDSASPNSWPEVETNEPPLRWKARGEISTELGRFMPMSG